MILITVGTHYQPFDRLVRAADELASRLDEPVIIQRGVGSYVPQFARHVEFVDEDQMDRWISEARVVISHAGAGSILGALRAGKSPILVPRKASFGEHIDDHQFELAGALAEQGRALMITDLSAASLTEAVEQATDLGSMPVGETGLPATLRDWLAEQATRPPSRRLRLLRWLARGR